MDSGARHPTRIETDRARELLRWASLLVTGPCGRFITRSYPTAIAALANYTAHDDTYYRAHFSHAGNEDSDFPAARPAYMLGHITGLSADGGVMWVDVEACLAFTWSSAGGRDDWLNVSYCARRAFIRGSSAEQRFWRARLATDETAALTILA